MIYSKFGLPIRFFQNEYSNYYHLYNWYYFICIFDYFNDVVLY